MTPVSFYIVPEGMIVLNLHNAFYIKLYWVPLSQIILGAIKTDIKPHCKKCIVKFECQIAFELFCYIIPFYMKK